MGSQTSWHSYTGDRYLRGSSIIGRRITKVNQTYLPKSAALEGCWDLHSLELEDGTIIKLHVNEREDEYAIQGTIIKPQRRAGRPKPLKDVLQ
jgi:hypothetical protein